MTEDKRGAFRERLDMLGLFAGQLLVYVLYVAGGVAWFEYGDASAIIVVPSLYYFVSFVLLLVTIVRGLDHHRKKKCWKILLVPHLILYGVVLPVLPLFGLSGLAWA